MALTVEDGSLVAGANSFVSIADADTFFTDRVDPVWTNASPNNVDNKTRALILASDYLMQKYRMRWNGSIVDATQALSWPRRGVAVPDFFDPFYSQPNVPLNFQNTYFIGEDVIPVEVKEAQMLLARAQMDSTGAVTLTLQTPIGRTTKREKAGALEVEYMTPAEGASATQTTEYWDAMQRIAPFLNPAYGISGRLTRN